MARKDIEVRIKARDEASRNAKKVADALKQLGTTGNNLGTTGTKVGGAMSAIGDGLGKLQGKLGGIDNLGKLVSELGKTTSVVDRLEKELSDTSRVLEEQTQKARAAAQTSAELKARLEAETAAQKQRADRIKQLTDARNKDTKSVLDAARAAEKMQKALAGGPGGFSGPRYPTKGVGRNSGAPISNARESAAVLFAPEIESGLGGKAALTAEVNALKAANDASKTSISALRGEIKAASAEERQFAADTEKAADQVTKLNEKLLAATGTWSKLDDEASKAAKELGGIALSQEAVAAATAKAEDELRKQAATLAAYERQAAKKLVGGGTIGDPTQRDQARAQADAMRQAREEVALLREEQARLDAAMRSGSGNVSAQVDAYDRMTRAVKLAEEQVRKLEIQQRLAQNTGATGFAKWAKVYNPIVTGAEAAAQSQERLSQSTRKSAAEAGKIAPMAQRNTGALRNQATATDKATQSVVKFGRDTRTTLSFMQRMRGEVLAMTSGFIGFYAALDRGQKAMDAFMAVQKAENRLGVAFEGDTAKVAREIGFLNEQADRLGFTFATLADGYGKISIAASNAGFAVADTRELFLSVAEAARVNGSSMDEMNGVLRALDQMLSKGKVQAEELRGQLGDRMSGAFKMFADGLGMTTAELDEAMKKGEVYANRDTMLAFARRLQEAYGSQVPKAMQTLAASLGTFERDMEKVNVSLAEGFVPALQAALKAFSEFANSAEGEATFRGIGEAAGSVISVLALIPQNLDLIVFGLKAIAAVGVARVFASLVTTIQGTAAGFMTFSANAATATAATTRFGAAQMRATGMIRQTAFALTFYETRLRSSTSANAIARAGTLGLATTIGALRTTMLVTAGAARALWVAIGGPIGAAALAISAVIAGWGSNANDATKALETHERHLQAVRTAYAEVGEGVDNWAEKIKGITELDARQSVATLEKQFEDALSGIASRARTIQNLVRQALRGGDMTNPDYSRDIQELDRLVQGFMAGTVEVEDFKKGLSDLATTSISDGVRNIATELNSMVEQTDDSGQSVATLSQSLKRAREILKAVTGQADEATVETLELTRATDDLNDTLGDNKLIEAYGEALDELKGKIPSLAEEMKKLKDVTDLNTAAWNAMVAAWKTGDMSKLVEVFRLYGQGARDMMQKNALSVFDGSSGVGGATGALIKKFEGFRSEPYWDVNAYRAGYGSDTVTLSDGSIQKVVEGITVSRADAERDLARRIVEFQNTVKGQIGETRFSAFNEQQQAVLTSIAYNYGSLPDRILDAVRNGSAEEISNAIMRLSGDNAGVNADRRAQESLIFSAGGDADINTLVEAEQDRLETMREQTEASRKRVADLDHELAQIGLINAGKEREAAIEDAIRAAKAENPNISAEELQAIRDKTAALWDQQNVNREIELQEERISQLQQLRQALMEQMDQARAAGDQSQLTALQTELDGVNQRLQEAIANGIKMWEAVGGTEAEAKIANLKTMQGSIAASKQEFGLFGLSMQTWQGVFDGAINGLVGAFDAMAQAVAQGENAFEAFGKAVLQTLAQVLKEIAVAIIRMQILKMLQGFGGGIGSMATTMLGGGMTGHTGGVVGSAAIGGGNSIRSAGWVQSALTYHTGGIAGLRPDEVSATLKKGEEILTEEDPRHRNNLGGESKGSQGARLTQVLAIGDNEIANAMKGKSGQDVTLTHIKSNAPTIKRMLGL